MAEEAILTVSLKEYKKQIDDLRASLLALEEGTEEYEQTVQEVKDRQDKLNQVMSIGKKNADALEGSYNYLVNEMARLKKEWRETADVARRNDLSKQILGINNQLKELDAGIGNFQRNVGNYGSVWEEAAKQGLKGLGGMGTALSGTFHTIEQMIPLIKKTTTAATTGLSGIKAAIISTGIGAIIVALSTILSNWSAISNAIFGVNDEIEKQKKLTEDLLDKNKEYEQKIKDEVKLMNAKGVSQRKILEYQKVEYANIQGNIEARMLELQTQIKQIEAQGWLINLLTGERGLLKDLKEQYKTLDEQRKNTQKTIHDITVDIEVEDIKKNKGTASARETFYKQTIERLKDFGKDEVQIAKETFEESLKKLEEERKKGLIKQEEYEKAKALLTQEYAKKRTDILTNEIKTAVDIVDSLNKQFDPDYNEKEIEQNYDLRSKALLKARDAEIALYGDTEEKKREITEKYVQAFQLLDKERTENYKKLEDERLEKARKTADDIAKSQMDRALKQENNSYKEKGLTDGNTLEDEIAHIQAVFDIRKAYFDSVIENNQRILEAENITADERIAAEERIRQAKQGIDDAITEYSIAQAEKRKNANQKEDKFTLKSAMDSARGIMGILDTLTDAYMSQIDMKVQNGEISEEEAQKEFERTKSLQYVAAVMETAQAAMGAYSSLASIPYVGPALGAAAAAAAIAAGAVQIQQIKNAKYGGTGGGGGETSPIIIPPMADYAPETVQNITGQSDIDKLQGALENTQIYVSVSDIDDAQNKKKVRVSESTW